MVHVRIPKTHSIGDQVSTWQNKWQDDLEKMNKDNDLGEEETEDEEETKDEEDEDDNY
jgi:hypothetical protein